MAKAVAPRGFARERVLEAALSLFAEHGVNGTSLQMIADRLGVSKAAVYYQFHSKDDIALAVIQPVFDDMIRLVRIAEAMSTPEARREAAISGMVEMAVRHRRVTAVFHGDPVIDSLVHSRRRTSGHHRTTDRDPAGPRTGSRRSDLHVGAGLGYLRQRHRSHPQRRHRRGAAPRVARVRAAVASRTDARPSRLRAGRTICQPSAVRGAASSSCSACNASMSSSLPVCGPVNQSTYSVISLSRQSRANNSTIS